MQRVQKSALDFDAKLCRRLKLYIAIFATDGQSNFFLPSWIEQFDLTKFTIALSSAWVE